MRERTIYPGERGPLPRHVVRCPRSGERVGTWAAVVSPPVASELPRFWAPRRLVFQPVGATYPPTSASCREAQAQLRHGRAYFSGIWNSKSAPQMTSSSISGSVKDQVILW